MGFSEEMWTRAQQQTVVVTRCKGEEEPRTRSEARKMYKFMSELCSIEMENAEMVEGPSKSSEYQVSVKEIKMKNADFVEGRWIEFQNPPSTIEEEEDNLDEEGEEGEE